MTAILIFAAFAGLAITIGGIYSGEKTFNWENGTGGGGCVVALFGAVIFLGSIGALIGRAYL